MIGCNSLERALFTVCVNVSRPKLAPALRDSAVHPAAVELTLLLGSVVCRSSVKCIALEPIKPMWSSAENERFSERQKTQAASCLLPLPQRVLGVSMNVSFSILQ